MLLSPTNFLWAKELIHSNILNYFDDPNGFVAITVPTKYPANTSSCILSEVSDHQETPTSGWVKRKDKKRSRPYLAKEPQRKEGTKFCLTLW